MERAGRPNPGLRLVSPDIYVWTETCNTYVVRDGDAALLIDPGDAGLLDGLTSVGIQDVEWVLITHHHREQCQGTALIRYRFPDARIGAPAAEREFLERPTRFRPARRALDDPHTVYGSSYLRPPVEPVTVDHAFAAMDDFAWRSHRFICIETTGNSPGSMSYLLRSQDGPIGFSGDVMLDGGRMHTWYDSEWDYGFGSGIVALYNSAVLLEAYRPSTLCPGHGPAIADPVAQLRTYRRKLGDLYRALVRGYPQGGFAYGDQDTVSAPTAISHLFRISPHLYKFRGPNFWPNFSLLMSESGAALIVDCGLVDEQLLRQTLDSMKQVYGLKRIEGVVITHMHGDHCLCVPFLKAVYGASVWTLDRVADLIERPGRYDYAAQIDSYGAGITSVPVDRVLRDGEVVRWHEYELRFDWMAGQTPFALCMSVQVDGRLVAFTGDNMFGNPDDSSQSGHEAVVARNGGTPEDGYLQAAGYLAKLAPQLIVGGHSWVIPNPAALIERYGTAARTLRGAFDALSSEPEYRYGFDPFWVRAEPYRITVYCGSTATFTVVIKNYQDRDVSHRVVIRTPAGVTTTPAWFDAVVAAGATSITTVGITVQCAAATGSTIIALDLTRDGNRLGELFDLILDVRADGEPGPCDA